jgi:hypothetical protein
MFKTFYQIIISEHISSNLYKENYAKYKMEKPDR